MNIKRSLEHLVKSDTLVVEYRHRQMLHTTPLVTVEELGDTTVVLKSAEGDRYAVPYEEITGLIL